MFFFIKNIIFTFLIFSQVIGCGYVMNYILKQNQKNFTFLFINGTMLLIFFSVVINFFISLNIYLTNTLFIFFALIGIYTIYKKIYYLHNLKLFLFLLIFASLIIYRSYPNNDYEFYHIPYMEILRNFKIIFGLSNFEFSYGHSLILQNISALQFNSLMNLDSYIYFTPLLVSIIIGEVLFKYIKSNNLLIKFISYIFLINFLIHANRYGSLGNDFPAHAVSFFSYILFFSLIVFNTNIEKSSSFVFTLLIAIFSKLTLLLNILLIIPFILLKKNRLKLNIRSIIFLFLFIFVIFLKNFINSSCLLYPLDITCFKTNWTPAKFDFSNAKIVNNYISALAYGYKSTDLGYSKNNIHFNTEKVIQNEIKNNYNIYNKLTKTQKKVFEKNAIYKKYIHFSDWLKNIPKNTAILEHFNKKILNDLLIFLLINLLFFYLYNGNYKFKKNLLYKTEKINKYYIFFCLFIVISSLVWFVKGALLRYGLSYIYIFTSMPFLFFIVYYATSFQKISSFFNIIILFTLVFSITENIVRINNFKLRDNYTNSIVPVKIVNYKRIFFNNIEISLPTQPRKLGRFCSFAEPLCLNQDIFLESDFKISNRNNYLFITK